MFTALTNITVASLILDQWCMVWAWRLFNRTVEEEVSSLGLVKFVFMVDDKRRSKVSAIGNQVILDQI
jgi:hypothetical protein